MTAKALNDAALFLIDIQVDLCYRICELHFLNVVFFKIRPTELRRHNVVCFIKFNFLLNKSVLN